MARDFVCPHCCTVYTGTHSLGAAVQCDRCFTAFTVLPFSGGQSSLLRLMGGAVFDMFAGRKCPNCRVRDSVHLGNVDGPQRVISGRWHDTWRSFYLCRQCNATWYYADALEA